MAGHSHWAGIKHKKAKEDKKRGKVFSRIAKQIMTAVRHGGKDPDMNLDLRYALDAAKDANMPKDNIKRAVLKGAGELPGQNPEEVRFEGYGINGVAVIVETYTDNRNRTTANLRKIFSDYGGELGQTGCVAWNFDTKGIITLELDEEHDEMEVFDVAIEAGAEDFQDLGDGFYEISCDPSEFEGVKKALGEHDIPWENAELAHVPKTTVDLDASDARKMLNMVDEFEDDEDVTSVAANFEAPDEVMAELENE
jgi:YebC/PmpR family DNA-binding regulatory protein